MSSDKPETEKPDERADSVSDPAGDAGEAGDWTGEGGATDVGPATDQDDDRDDDRS